MVRQFIAAMLAGVAVVLAGVTGLENDFSTSATVLLFGAGALTVLSLIVAPNQKKNL